MKEKTMESGSLESDLSRFDGTQTYYPVTFLNIRFFLTEGAKFFVDKAEAHWLVTDLMSLEVEKKMRKEYFWSIELNVSNDKSAVLRIGDGNKNILYTQKYEYTDCPTGCWKFFAVQQDDVRVLMLRSEY